jgi:hypothetical protein
MKKLYFESVAWSNLLSLPFLLTLTVATAPALISSISILVFSNEFYFLDSDLNYPENFKPLSIITKHYHTKQHSETEMQPGKDPLLKPVTAHLFVHSPSNLSSFRLRNLNDLNPRIC